MLPVLCLGHLNRPLGTEFWHPVGSDWLAAFPITNIFYGIRHRHGLNVYLVNVCSFSLHATIGVANIVPRKLATRMVCVCVCVRLIGSEQGLDVSQPTQTLKFGRRGSGEVLFSFSTVVFGIFNHPLGAKT